MAVLAGGLAVRTVIGFGHIEQGHTLLEMGGLFFLTGAGGVTFAWLVYQWRSLESADHLGAPGRQVMKMVDSVRIR
jgi:hypothetical protein